MSHIVTIATRLHDRAAINAACRRLGLSEPVEGTARLYSGEATGLVVNLPGWTYPVVIDPLGGTAKYDNYNGAWGETCHLEKFLQSYAVEKARQEARARGMFVSEQTLTDGSIRLHIHEGG